MNVEDVYKSLPITLQHVACSLEGWRLSNRRYDHEFRNIRETVNRRATSCAAERERLKHTRLRAHIQAALHSPFWKERFERYGVNASSEHLEDELQKLPILTKDEVQDQADNIRNPAIENIRLLSNHTSGTTGSGLVFPETPAAEKERWAVWWRYRGWHGLTQDMWCGYFGGRSVVPFTQSTPPFWRLNHPGRQILFSGYHISPTTAGHYLNALDKYAPSWLHGYPSHLSLIAGYLLERGKPLKRTPIIVTTGAENLLPQQKQLMQKAFGCPVRQHYGQVESVANISECPEGHLHVDEDFSLVEFLPIDDQSNVCAIVGTNWSNPAFPLIRYDTGDHVRLISHSPSCRMSGRVVACIDGRKEDYVVLPSGVRLGRLDHIFKNLTQIREAQIYQPERNMVILKIVKRDRYSSRDEHHLLREAHNYLGREIGIRLEYVSSLKRTQTGKLRFVVSEVA